MARGIFIGSTALATAILGLPIPRISPADESRPDPRTAFERTARRAGPEYMVGRAYLVQQGRDLLPLLREKSKRDTARARSRSDAGVCPVCARQDAGDLSRHVQQQC